MTFTQISILLLYLVLLPVWGYIFVFAWRNYRRDTFRNGVVQLLFLILLIEAFRTLIENSYFGLARVAAYDLLPYGLSDGLNFLNQPAYWILPKLVNLLATLLILLLILRRWLPERMAVLQRHQNERQQLQQLYQREHHLSDLLGLTADINQILLHAEALDPILRQCCERLTRQKGYQVAWIGLLAKAGDEFEVEYHSDLCNPPYLDRGLQMSLDGSDPLGRGPAGVSVRENRVVLIDDVERSEDFAPWRARARACGLRRVIGLPLHPKEGGTPIGCLLIYSDAADGFSEREVTSLKLSSESIGRAIQLQRETNQRCRVEEELRRSEQRLQYVIAGANLGFWDLDYNSGQQEVSHRWLAIIGLRREEASGHVNDWLSRIHPEDKQRVEMVVKRAIELDVSCRVEFRMRHKNGSWIWIEGSGSVVERDPASGEPLRLCGTHQEITQRKNAERYLRESEERFKELIDSLPNVAVQGYDQDRRVIYWNESSARIYGYSRQEAMGRRLEELIIPAPMQQGVVAGVRAWIEEDQEIPSGELTLQRKDGSLVPVHSSHVLLRRDTGSPEMFCIDVDLREQKRVQRELTSLATFDSLTQLPNRNLLDQELSQRLQEAVRFGQRLAVMFIDLDDFKMINDTLGHDQGDLLLQAVSERFSAGLRSYDTLARFGGDEFVLVMPQIESESEVGKVAGKLIEMLGAPFLLGEESLKQAVYVSASVGISLYPEDGNSSGELLKNADMAMYRAKEAGRNGFQFFTRQMNHEIHHQRQMETKLHHALEQGEFLLYYQPQIDLSSGQIVSCEALIRWRGADGELIPPGLFLPVAERSSLINRIGQWVVEEACRQKAEWKMQGLVPVRIDVNLSGRQFLFGELFSMLQQTFTKHRIGSEDVGIELTEQTLIEADADILDGLRKLVDNGTCISLDDFGTGYSSLGYLKQFPVNILKIDREFVRDAPDDPSDQAIIQAVVTIGHSLGLRVLVEGVETAQQLQLARALQCDLAQGFYFHRPMSAAALEKLLVMPDADPQA